MNHPLRCRCGALRGHLVLPATAARAVCYCKDCQAYAHFLGDPGRVLDAAGGSDIVAIAPSRVRLEQGLERLACMSLSPRGLLRWYAGCCMTPIGNTPRDARVHYLGLVHSCLDEQPLDAAFGAARVRINTGSARRKVTATPVAATVAMLRLLRVMVPARWSGRWRRNPFFDDSGVPAREPQVIDAAERARLTAAVQAS
ncbi:DUF6151 family protein [Piscinibacter koreensis]|uniref:CENP-V/GFA domain-containing protein n=1 Tax=Piscinibacter koreensis TaxID=2742824 RepID=A0A7Y6NSC4_9BURK|nr:DUF6151 family protein [Schlegelella koreensis]NUZ08287.1 hypothetical protein [Schlegelella koreensis]